MVKGFFNYLLAGSTLLLYLGEEPTEVTQDTAIRAILSNMGKPVRVVNAGVPSSDESVVDTELGKTVYLASLGPDALCNVVVESDTMPKDAFAAVPLAGSCIDKMCIWVALYKRDWCLEVPDRPGYLASTAKEILALPIDTRKRILRQWATWEGPSGPIQGLVPIGDPRADPESPVIFPANWAAMHLNIGSE